MAARAGIEPVLGFLQACLAAVASEMGKSADTQIRAQKISELREMVEAWPNLSVEFRATMLAMTESASKRQQQAHLASSTNGNTGPR